MLRYKVLCCGSNGNYQLGLLDDEDHDTFRNSKFKIEDDSCLSDTVSSKPKKIVCGGNHSFILLEDNTLFACGENKYGQCGGIESVSHLKHFHRIPGNWIDVAASWEHSTLVNANNELFSCGLGLKGELGLGSSITRTDQLVKINFKFPSPVKKVKSSLNHCIVMLENGDLYGWGNCRKGQLGIINELKPNGKPKSVIWSPEKLQFKITKYPILDFDVGRDLTFILDSSNAISIFGKINETLTLEIPIFQIKSMWSSIHYASCNNKGTLMLNSYGNNSHGQCFPTTSALNFFVKDYEIGSEHGLLLTNTNQVYAWGWGEHGNCGIHTKAVSSKIDDQVTFDYLNLVYSEEKEVVLLGGGCATSWFVVSIDK